MYPASFKRGSPARSVRVIFASSSSAVTSRTTSDFKANLTRQSRPALRDQQCAHRGYQTSSLRCAQFRIQHPIWAIRTSTTQPTKNFEPRAGFAYDPFKDHRTSIRALVTAFTMFCPCFISLRFCPSSALPTSRSELPAILQVKLGAKSCLRNQRALTAKASTLGQAYIDPNPKRNYVMQWNLSVQHELARDVTVSAGYAGSRGLHLPLQSRGRQPRSSDQDRRRVISGPTPRALRSTPTQEPSALSGG